MPINEMLYCLRPRILKASDHDQIVFPFRGEKVGQEAINSLQLFILFCYSMSLLVFSTNVSDISNIDVNDGDRLSSAGHRINKTFWLWQLVRRAGGSGIQGRDQESHRLAVQPI